MRKTLPIIVVFALVLMTNPAMAGTPPGFEPSAWAAAEASQKDVSAPDQAGCGWQSGFFLDDLDNTARAFAVYDDGTGPALLVGGEFIAAGGVMVNGIAKWNGIEWSALSGPWGMGMGGSYPYVYALAVFDDGNGAALYAGGRFTEAGGVTVNYIAKWDGTAWSALSGPSGAGMDDEVRTLAVYDDGTGAALYAGGEFTTAGGVTVNRIVKWDGTAWSALSGPSGNGMNFYVNALTVYDDGGGQALYAGGDFVTAGGVTVNYIAKWDGTAWSALSGPSGTGVAGSSPHVNVLAVYDDGTGSALYAGGNFVTAGGVTVNRIAKWDGTAWSALSGPSGTGMNFLVSALVVYDDGTGSALYAGGNFFTAGGITVNRIAKWNGTAWSALPGPSGAGMNDSVYTLGVHDDGTGAMLYAGGDFTIAGEMAVNHIAKWNGTGWSTLNGPSGAGTNGSPFALAVYDDGTGPALYAGGEFLTAGGVTVHRIAKWNGTAWSALYGPSDTGTSWHVRALAVFDDGTGEALYAGGEFGAAGGVTVNFIAKWDGTEWSVLFGPYSAGMSYEVYALAVYDDGTGEALYAGGYFTTAGGVTVNRIAKWNGTEWSALSGPSGAGIEGSVYALAVYDDHTGPAMYVGGEFIAAGGLLSSRIARWVCDSGDPIFFDGFETGDMTRWSASQP